MTKVFLRGTNYLWQLLVSIVLWQRFE